MSLYLSEFNWQLILIIVAISAVVSYVGDALGTKIGKKRISLLGLRPKYTSTVITILTGVGVALLTLFVAATTSQTVRGAFFGVNYLDRQISQLHRDLRERQFQLGEMEMEVYSARQEFEKLNAETESLKKGLTEMKEGRVIASQGELLAQTSLAGGSKRADAEAALEALTRQAEENLSRKLQELGSTSREVRVEISDDDKKMLVRELVSANTRKALRMTAPSNVVQGQVVEGLVALLDSRLVYEKDAVLTRNMIQGGMSHDQAADVLYAMLKQINRRAVREGVLPDPIAGTVGNLDSIEFYETVDRVAESKTAQFITFSAATDIYTEGPVDIRMTLSPEG